MGWFRKLRQLWTKISQASDTLSQFEQAGPAAAQPAMAFMSLAIQQAERGEFNKACLNFAQAAEIEPQKADIFANWGVTLAKAKHLDAAHEKFSRASELEPERAVHYVLWGACLVELGHLDEAEEKYKQAIALKPRHVEPWLNWAIALSRAGYFDLARPKVERVLQLNNANPQAFYLLGAILAEEEKYSEAAEKLRTCLKFEVKHAEALFLLGMVYHKMGRDTDAIEQFDKALQLTPEKVDLLHAYGDSQFALGDVQLAEHSLLKALSIAPRQGDILLSLAKCRYRTGSTEEAMALYEQVEEFDPETANLYSVWGLSLLEQNDEAAAYETLKRHEEHLESIDQIGDPSWWLGMVVACARLTKWEEGQTYVDKGLQLFPTKAHLLHAQGVYAASQGLFQDACNSFEDATTHKKEFYQARLNKGLMLLQTGEALEGLRHFRAEYRQHVDDPLHTTFYALAQLASGDWEEAEGKLEALLEKYPSESRAISALVYLYVLHRPEKLMGMLNRIQPTEAMEDFPSHWLFVLAVAYQTANQNEEENGLHFVGEAEALWRVLQSKQCGLDHVMLLEWKTLTPWRFWLIQL